MAHHEKIDTMIKDTRTKLGGGATTTTPEEGINLAEDWIVILRTQPAWSEFVEPLERLTDALEAHDFVQVQQLLKDIARQTAETAEHMSGEYKEKIQDLAVTLKDFHDAMAK